MLSISFHTQGPTTIPLASIFAQYTSCTQHLPLSSHGVLLQALLMCLDRELHFLVVSKVT